MRNLIELDTTLSCYAKLNAWRDGGSEKTHFKVYFFLTVTGPNSSFDYSIWFEFSLI